MLAKSIEEVVQVLDGIIEDCRMHADPLGYFPALYRAVTLRVRNGIATGFFDDGTRMEAFATAFANRYFAAYDAFRTEMPLSKCWRAAFEDTRSDRLLILQCLIVGINAHINLDLGMAAAEMFPADVLPTFHADFDRINRILGDLLPEVETTVSGFSPLLHILVAIGGKPATQTLNFTLLAARDDAWLHAKVLAALPPEARTLAERVVDDKATLLERVVAQPLWPVSAAVDVVRHAESHDVEAVISGLLALS